jgi:hypothetical protein
MNGMAVNRDRSLLNVEPTSWDHHAQGLFESTILGFPSFKRYLHCFVRGAAQAKAELVFPEFNLSDFEVPTNCKIVALNIYPPVIRRLKVLLE